MNAFVTRWLGHHRWPLIAGGLAIVLTLPSLWTGLVADDYVHRAMFLKRPGFALGPLDMFSFVRGGAHHADEVRRLSFPWWAAPDLKLAFWRPLTALTHALDYVLWPDAPWLMHWHSLLWYAAAVVVVSLLFLRIFDIRWHAELAAFAYAVSHAHAMAVFFIANRNALLGVCFGVGSLLLHDRWRQRGGRAAAALAPVALLAGLLSNEGAIAACAYLFAYAVYLDKATLRSRALGLVPYAAIVVGWRLVYQLQGYGAFASEAYIDPMASPARFVQAAIVREPMYLLSQWLFPPTDWSGLVSATVFTYWWLGAVGFVIVLLVGLLPLLRRDRTARFWCTGMLLSLIPSCAAFPTDRMLLYSGIGGAALLAQLVGAVDTGAYPTTGPRFRAMAGRVLVDLFIASQLIWSPVWLAVGIVTTASALDHMTDGIKALADEKDLSGKLVVLVDDVGFTSAYFPALRALSGHDPVGQLLVLAPVEGRLDPIVLSRPSADTLTMEVDGGYRWFLERDDAHRFAAGDTVDLNRVKVEILRVSTDGRPTKVAFHFDARLEDESIAWFARLEPASAIAFPTRGRYPRWQPPPIGQTIAAR